MSEAKNSKSFKDWSQDDLEFALGVVRTLKMPVEMKGWISLAKQMTLTEAEKESLKELRDLADEEIDGWNETELREFFLMDLIKMVNFRLPEYKINRFAERYISTIVQGIKMYGFVDFIVAKGKKKHQQPFFFIHEYKQEEGGSNDARGQLVSTMVASQNLNKKPPKADLFNPSPNHYYKDMPLYGLYLLGRFWFFVTLKGKKYYVSKAADISDLEELFYITKMLKAQKQMILERVKNYEVETVK